MQEMTEGVATPATETSDSFWDEMAILGKASDPDDPDYRFWRHVTEHCQRVDDADAALARGMKDLGSLDYGVVAWVLMRDAHNHAERLMRLLMAHRYRWKGAARETLENIAKT